MGSEDENKENPSTKSVTRRDFMKATAALGFSALWPRKSHDETKAEAPDPLKILQDFKDRFDPGKIVKFARIIGDPSFLQQPSEPEEEINQDIVLPIKWLKPDRVASIGDKFRLAQEQLPHVVRILLPVLSYEGRRDLNAPYSVAQSFTEYPSNFIVPQGTKKTDVLTFQTEEILEEGTIFKLSWLAIKADPMAQSGDRTIEIKWSYDKNANRTGGGGGTDIVTPTDTAFLITDMEIVQKQPEKLNVPTFQG